MVPELCLALVVEVPGVKHLTINDLDPVAVERAHTNLAVNNLTGCTITKLWRWQSLDWKAKTTALYQR
jgi:ribosomal protein L11 methylase PrmA